MLFDKEEIVLPARTSVIIRFKNPDEMPHNFVIIKKGSLVKVGKAADAMAATKDGFAKKFYSQPARSAFICYAIG